MAFAIPCLSLRPSRLRPAIRRLLADCSSLLAKPSVHLSVLCHLRGGGTRSLPYRGHPGLGCTLQLVSYDLPWPTLEMTYVRMI